MTVALLVIASLTLGVAATAATLQFRAVRLLQRQTGFMAAADARARAQSPAPNGRSSA